MSLSAPPLSIPRRSLAGMEAMWAKMWDPPTESPNTPDLVAANNPVPAFIAATIPGATVAIPNTVRREGLHAVPKTMWDGTTLNFMGFRDPDINNVEGVPGPTIRIPRGKIFHCETHGMGPPPHTIHWHGIEPTPMNDGVGHCSMELGTYTYQFQPNFIGTYFYHCHRNTVQHFESGLYGMLLIEPPDAYDPPNNPGGYPRRTAANTSKFPQFPGFNPNPVATDPLGMTVPYDVEALWVLDDIDSVWRTVAADPKAFYPRVRGQPGVDDQFFHGFFHDHNPDYFWCTGVNFVGPVGSPVPAQLDAVGNLPVPPEQNSGVSGMQVAVNALVNQTILIRCLCAAYVTVTVRLPVDAVVVAWDGRALGVWPFTRYNYAYLVKAGTPIPLSTARRFDALVRSATPVASFAEVQFTSPRTGALLLDGRIPFNIA